MHQTQRKYLGSLEHLCKFFTSHQKFDVFCFVQRIAILCQNLNDMFTSKRTIGCELNAKVEKDSVAIPKPEDISAYLKCSKRSKLYGLCTKLKEEMDQLSFLLYNLFLELSCTNGLRAREFKTLKFMNMKVGVLDHQGERFVVATHKNSNGKTSLHQFPS